ncbi:MAG: ParB/Srx family N-terminal domain-containing protein [Methylobacter sp.]
MSDRRAFPKVESWPIDKIIPYEKNAKLHTKQQIDELAAIIKERGFRRPISVDEEGVIIAGHGRRLAALKLGYTKLPVIVERGLTEAQKAADRIADNMVSRGGFDEVLLGEEVMRLASIEDFDINLLGMSELEIGDIFEKFTADDLDAMLTLETVDLLDATQADKPAKPAPSGVDYQPFYSVVIECSGEDEQRELYEALKADGRKCKIQTM